MGVPSSLPSFVGLARRIAAEAGRDASEADLARPDVYLGDLSADVDVNLRVQEIIRESTEPTELHRALVALAGRTTPRIVTTNYDLHLSTEGGRLAAPLREYEGPALPRGDDFTGLVYLHASVREEPRHLVVTDRDFGRAYLTDAWAARFLHDMFRTYVVLFVGYSHDDVVMTYLARGLPREARRYALTTSEGGWRRLGITPVLYPAADDHAALTRAVSVWAAEASMGLLDHRERVRSLVAAPPPEDPVDRSYLKRVVEDPETVWFFCEFARGERWLEWASQRPAFRALFAPSPVDIEPTGAELAWWFVENFALNPELVATAFATVQTLGGRLAPPLWYALAQRLHAADPKPPFAVDWAVLLSASAPERGSEFLEYLLVSCNDESDRDMALLLFDHLTAPQLELRPSFGYGADDDDRPTRLVDTEVRPVGSDHWLDEAWEKIFRPRLAEDAFDVLAVVERHLRHAHRVQRALGRATANWDPVSFRRAAIEPHEQDAHRDPMDPLIDAARDSVVALLAADPPAGSAVLDAWIRSDVPLLRRLAVHAWSERGDRGADEKIAWVVDRGLLFEHTCRHESYRLLEKSLPQGSAECVDRLVEAVTAGMSDDEADAYERFCLLSWITRAVPDHEGVVRAFAELQDRHPNFGRPEHPDLAFWHETGVVGGTLPMAPEQFHAALDENLLVSVRRLVEDYRDETSPFAGPTWNDALDLVASTVAAYPEDGSRLLELFRSYPELGVEIGPAVLRGLARADTGPVERRTLFETLTEYPLLDTLAREATEMLVAERSEGGLAPEDLGAARSLARALWPHTDSTSAVGGDWMHRAMNSTAGRLARLWVHTVSIERTGTDDWRGLPEDVAMALEEIITGDEDRHAFARVILGGHLHFLFSTDEDWCRTHLLPAFDWSRDDQAAAQAWTGYLYWGRWNDRLLAAGLLDLYEQTWAHAETFDDQLRRSLATRLAWITVQSSLPTVRTDLLRRFHAQAGEDLRVRWADEMADILGRDSRELARRQWTEWVTTYWGDRLNSIPRPLSPVEASAMARWCLSAGDDFPAAVDLALRSPAGLGGHSVFLYRLAEGPTPRDHPADTARLLAHLLRHTPLSFYGCHYLERVVRAIHDASPGIHLEAVVTEAVRLHCSAAPTWLES